MVSAKNIRRFVIAGLLGMSTILTFATATLAGNDTGPGVVCGTNAEGVLVCKPRG